MLPLGHRSTKFWFAINLILLWNFLRIVVSSLGNDYVSLVSRESITKICIWYGSDQQSVNNENGGNILNQSESRISTNNNTEKSDNNKENISFEDNGDLIEKCVEYSSKKLQLPCYIEFTIKASVIKEKTGCLCSGPRCNTVTICVSFFYRRSVNKHLQSVSKYTTLDACLTNDLTSSQFGYRTNSFEGLDNWMCDTSNTKRLKEEKIQVNEWIKKEISFRAKCQDSKVRRIDLNHLLIVCGFF